MSEARQATTGPGNAGGRMSLAQWRERFAELDECPWPGPRPLDPVKGDIETLLVGRAAERAKFHNQLANFPFVLLTGSTGVGKTSLIQAALVPDLRADGNKVSLCRDWSGSLDEAKAIDFLAAKVRAGFGDDVGDLPEGAALFWQLNSEYRDRCVIVLDQFEELIRDAPSMTGPIYRLITDLNQKTNLKIVISFRNEYLQDLLALERSVRPFTMSHVALTTIDPSFAVDVINAARIGDQLAITPTAAATVAEQWTAAVGRGDVTLRDKIGLLHLQAMLYCLAAQAGRTATGEQAVVTDEHVTRLFAQLDRDADGNAPQARFRQGLITALDQKIDRCRAASVDIDRYLVDGTARMLAEAAPHLSSGGYKLIRDARDLMTLSLDQNLDTLLRGAASACDSIIQLDSGGSDGPLPRGDCDVLLDSLLDLIHAQSADASAGPDLLQARRRQLADLADEKLGYDSWAHRLHPGADPRAADPAKTTNGPMDGQAPAAVLIEELRRFVFAIEWLQASSIVRLTTPGAGSAMVALVHDGFGTALERWSASEVGNPSGDLAAITAPSGGSFVWALLGDVDALIGDERPRLLTNLRWRGAWVTARFRNVAFVNCDLRAIGFNQCVFDGVAFINCLLDGAMFSDCTIVGTPAEAPAGWRLKLPEFRIAGAPELAQVLARYTEQDGDFDSILATVAGKPAVPYNGPHPSALLWHPEPGLVIHGGRISALTVRGCHLGEDGTLSIRQSAGSGLEVVEHEGGRIEILASALRHLAVSGARDLPSDSRPSGPTVATTVSIRDSSVVQGWLSDGLSGSLAFVDCSIVQFWNASEAIKATAQASSYLGLSGIDLLDGPEPGQQCTPIDEATTRDEVYLNRFHRMDYRRDPSWEAERSDNA